MNTIDTILKLSGHKDINSFYKEFPDEASFQAKHGKAFAKAQRGAKIKKAQYGNILGPTNVVKPVNASLPGFPVISKPQSLPTFDQGVSDYMAQGSNAAAHSWDATAPKTDLMSMINPGIAIGEKLAKAIKQLKAEKQAKNRANQWAQVSDVNLKASQLTPEPIERKYTRPEDIINTGDKFFPVYGVGTDALAKKGKKIKKANFGEVLQGIGSDRLTNLAVGMSGGESAGATFGEAAGDIISMIPGVGPIVGTLAKPILSAVGNLIDTNPEKTKRYQDRFEGNINQMAMGKGMQGLFNTNNAYMASGGNVSNMETEGELRIGKGGAKSLSYNPFLPDGGETIEFTGPSHAQGGMPVSYGNSPVEVEGGEPAIKLQNGGADEDLVVFGELKILGTNQTFKKRVKDLSEKEAKENKKAEKALLSIEDLSPTNSFDKLKINSAKATLMGTTQKLKGYADEKQKLSALQEAINQTAEEMGMDANALSKGKYKMAKKGASISKAQEGGIYDKIWNDAKTAGVPNFYLHGVKYDTSTGKPIVDSPIQESEVKDPIVNPTPSSSNLASTPVSTYENITEQPIIPNYIGRKKGLSLPGFPVMDRPVPLPTFAEGQSNYVNPPMSTSTFPTFSEGISNYMKQNSNASTNSWDATKPSGVSKEEDKETTDGEEKKKGWEYAIDALNAYLPYFRPSDTERLDPRQLMGEMFALTDKEEPVQAQFFQPQLGSPYSVSFADQKNDVIAQMRSAQRMAGNNPAAQAMIASQAAQALNKINAEEFRMNQGMADKVYGENRATMNQAQLQNLQIADNQYTRQSQAKSNTKARLQAALNSISDKYLKNELNNKILATYENLHNYRSDDRGIMQNWNQPAQFNPYGSGNPEGRASGIPDDWIALYDEKGKFQGTRRKTSKDDDDYEYKPNSSRNGSIVKALKRI